MDGGGNSNVGHGVQPGHGGGDGGGFLDGGHHDHGSHSMHGGDGGGFLNNVLGYNQHNGQHSFISHLLGLDHDAHGGGHAQHGTGTPTGHAPSQTPIWNSAMQAMKLEHAIDGIKITTNGWFFIMFAGFISWLFVLYWIRHHEPFADAVLGKGTVQSPTLAADRRMMDNCREAMPIRTNPNQQLFVPIPQQFGASSAAAANPQPMPNAPPSSTETPWMPPATLPQTQSAAQANTAALPTYNLGPYADNGIYTPQANAVSLSQANGPAVNMPVPSASGPRLRTIVNR